MAKAKENILALIEADHRKLEDLIKEFESAKGAKKQQSFTQIYQETILHARAEELVFYPAMREYEEASEYIEEAEEEHAEAEALLEQMKAFNPEDQEFMDLFGQLKEALMHHIGEEEEEVFEVVRDCMEEDELKSLGQEFQDAKKRVEGDVKEAITR